MGKKLQYGGHEIGLGEDEEIAALRDSISNAVKRGGDWVRIVKAGDQQWLWVDRGIPIVVSEITVKERRVLAL